MVEGLETRGGGGVELCEVGGGVFVEDDQRDSGVDGMTVSASMDSAMFGCLK